MPTYKCIECDKEFKNLKKKKYCSINCRNRATRNNWKFSDKKLVKEAHKRDNNRCTICGLSEGESLKNHKRHLLIHHINLDHLDNRVDNFQLVCQNCHNKLHGLLNRKKFPVAGEFNIHKEVFLRCAHNLRDGYQGNCKRLHGEFYKIEVWITGNCLDKFGFVVDFNDISKYLKNKYDHRYINQIKPFNKINPTAENLSRILFLELSNLLQVKYKLTNPKVRKIRVYESDTSYCEFS